MNLHETAHFSGVSQGLELSVEVGKGLEEHCFNQKDHIHFQQYPC